MTRERGKRTQRPIKFDPESPEGRGYGASDRTDDDQSPIPGGKIHLTNPESVRHTPAIPAAQGEYRGTMAHGMPPGTHTTLERADAERGPNAAKSPKPVYYVEKDQAPDPVPVYLVAEGGGRYPLKISVPRHVTVHGFNADPICIVGVDPKRTKVRVMNNDPDFTVRIASDPTALVQDVAATAMHTIGGALLPAGMTKYQDIETQDELYAVVQDLTHSVELQIIMETSKANAG